MSTPKKITLSWAEEAWEDNQYWLDNDKPKTRKLRKLFKECMRPPLKAQANLNP